MIRGCLVLLTVAILAILWHNINHGSLRGTQATKQSTDLHGSEPHNVPPEQKFLITGPLNINKATVEELEAVPRIGPSLAKKMIEFRSEKGRINDINELLDIKGVGPRLLTTIGPYLTTTK